MSRIKSVTMRKTDVKHLGAREYHQYVMEDGEGWDLAIFRLHHFEGMDKLVFHRAGNVND